MRIVAWNLAHKTVTRPLHKDLARVIRLLSPDVLTLNEYVDDRSRQVFKDDIHEMGLCNQAITTRVGRSNQVLTASRFAFDASGIQPPRMDDNHSEPNFLPLAFPSLDLEVVGMRVPWYKKAEDRRSYWTAFEEMVRSVSNRRVIFIGDLNVDPNGRRRPESIYLQSIKEAGWQIPDPIGAWSFVSGSRLDHALVSPLLPMPDAAYITEIEGMHLVSELGGPGISDHAPLVVDLEIFHADPLRRQK